MRYVPVRGGRGFLYSITLFQVIFGAPKLFVSLTRVGSWFDQCDHLISGLHFVNLICICGSTYISCWPHHYLLKALPELQPAFFNFSLTFCVTFFSSPVEGFAWTATSPPHLRSYCNPPLSIYWKILSFKPCMNEFLADILMIHSRGGTDWVRQE